MTKRITHLRDLSANNLGASIERKIESNDMKNNLYLILNNGINFIIE